MKKIKALLLAMAMVVTVSGLAVAQDRDDDNRRRDDDYNSNHREDNNRQWGQNRTADAREYGFHNGYRTGWREGRMVRSSQGQYGSWGNGQWGNGGYRGEDNNNGYQRWMGSKGQYKQGFREGYRSGYSDAYYGRRAQTNTIYGQNGQSTPWDPDGDGDVHYPQGTYGQGNNGGYNGQGNGYGNGYATRFGAADGQQAGQRDRASRHSYRPTEWQAYKDADHGMSSSQGYRSSDQYKQEYRQAFMNGYNQAYGNGYRR